MLSCDMSSFDLPLSTHFFAVALTHLCDFANKSFFSLLGLCHQVIHLNVIPVDWKIFDKLTICTQLSFTVVLLWIIISKGNLKYFYIWLWCQSAMTIILLFRIPVILKDIFSSYKDIYPYDTNLYAVNDQILSFYLLLLGILLYPKIKTVDIQPAGTGWRNIWNYYYYLNSGYGLHILFFVETIVSLSIVIEETHAVTYGMRMGTSWNDPAILDGIFIRSARLLLGMWAMCSLILTKQKRIQFCVLLWIPIYVCLFLASMGITASIALSQYSNEDEGNEEDMIFDHYINASSILMCFIDFTFRTIIIISTIGFNRRKHNCRLLLH